VWAGRPFSEADCVSGRECVEASGTPAADGDGDFGWEGRVGASCWSRGGGTSVDLTRGRRQRRVFGLRLLEGHVVGVLGMNVLCRSDKFDKLGRLKYVLAVSRKFQGSIDL
jgi:hypothetical protein